MVPIRFAAFALLVVACLTTPAWSDTLIELRARTTLESAMLHKRLCLSGLQQWQPERGVFEPSRPQPALLQVLHLWAVDCLPCVAELPLWRELQQGWADERRISFLFVSETIEPAVLTEFLAAQRAQLPSGPMYRLTNPRLRRTLGREVRPVTLLLDAQGVVRNAIVGSITQRRGELIGAMERLLAVLNPVGSSGQDIGCP